MSNRIVIYECNRKPIKRRLCNFKDNLAVGERIMSHTDNGWTWVSVKDKQGVKSES